MPNHLSFHGISIGAYCLDGLIHCQLQKVIILILSFCFSLLAEIII